LEGKWCRSNSKSPKNSASGNSFLPIAAGSSSLTGNVLIHPNNPNLSNYTPLAAKGIPHSNPAMWDYRSFSNESAGHYYMFDAQAVPFNLSATIAWDRHVTDYNAAPPPLNDTVVSTTGVDNILCSFITSLAYSVFEN